MSKYLSFRIFLVVFSLIVPALLLHAQEKATEMAVKHQADHIMLVPRTLPGVMVPPHCRRGQRQL